MLVGPVSETIGPTTTLVAAGTVGIVTNLVALSVPSIRRLGWREEAPTPEGQSTAPISPAEGPVAGPLEID